MGERTSKELTVLFADVAGSVELYSALGDLKAHSLILHFLHSMTALVERYQGRVVETIGDEIMCVFNSADSALAAACTMQENMRSDRETELNIRVGLHSGLTSMENGHPFGDTVNVAARVVAIAKAGQVMLSDYACQRLSTANKARTCFFSKVYIKGKSAPYIIHQALWNQEDRTTMTRRNAIQPDEQRLQVKQFYLRYKDTESKLIEGTEFLIGRGEQCGLRVDSEAASRIHATVKCQGGKLLLVDRSTNGTFVKTMSAKHSLDIPELFFHHDEWMTTCNGVISLGKPIDDHNDCLIYLRCS